MSRSMSLSLFVCHMEVSPRAECEVLDPAHVAGAYVRCYAREQSLEAALARFRTAAEAIDLTVVDIHWIVNDEHTEWESPDDTDGRRLAEEARASDEVIFGEFQAWASADLN
jgi:hypothetical protein